MWFDIEPNGSDLARGMDAMAEMFCPACGSNEWMDRHHEGNLAAPECDYKECGECGYQWDHS